MSNPALEPRVSVVIVNYNGGPYLLDTLRSVLASSVPVEALVVDNGSHDESVLLLRSELGQEPRLRIIENGANLGFARANNIGFAAARADHILVLNPDCVLEPDTLERMLAILERHPGVGMAGCLIRNPDGSEQAGCRRSIPTPWTGLLRALHLSLVLGGKERLNQVDLTHHPLPAGPVPVEAISGAFMLVRRPALDQVGPMDPGYFLHCEDLDWCKAFQQAGWHILFVPDVAILHHKGVCSNERPLFVLWHKHRGMVRFYRKFLRHSYSAPLNLLVVLGVWLRFAVSAPAAWLALQWRNHVGAGSDDLGRGDQRSPASGGALPLLPELRDRAVLVTGGTGFVGQRLVAELLRQGAQVSVLTRDPAQARVLWPADQVRLLAGDLADPLSLGAPFKDIDILFHLASQAHVLDQDQQGSAQRHRLVTERGTQALLGAIARSGLKSLVFASSVKAMGEEDPRCLDEDHPPHPESPYGQAKLAAERLMLAISRPGGPRVAVVRLPMVYGPGNKGNLPRMIEAIERGRFPPLPRTGNRRSMLHVEDAVQALLLAAVRPEAAGQVYVATDGHAYATSEIYRLISQGLGRRPPRWKFPLVLLHGAARLGDWLSRLGLPTPISSVQVRKLLGSAWYNDTKIHRELGFKAHHDLEGALPAILADMHLPSAATPGANTPAGDSLAPRGG